jgi:hypothetical protein
MCFGIPHIIGRPSIGRRWNFLVWPKCDVFNDPHIIYCFQGIPIAQGRKKIQSGGIYIAVPPRYYGQEHNLSNLLFPPYHCTVMGSTVFQSASKSSEKCLYMVRPSKMVEL